MKCKILLSGKNKKKNIINLSSAELAQRMIKVKDPFLIETAALKSANTAINKSVSAFMLCLIFEKMTFFGNCLVFISIDQVCIDLFIFG